MSAAAKYYVSGLVTMTVATSLRDALAKGKDGDRIIRVCSCGCGGAAAVASHVIRDGKIVKVST